MRSNGFGVHPAPGARRGERHRRTFAQRTGGGKRVHTFPRTAAENVLRTQKIS
jgi:hypothetical protein